MLPHIAECTSMEPTEDMDVEFYETDRGEENMSVSDDAASEEPSSTEDSDGEDLELCEIPHVNPQNGLDVNHEHYEFVENVCPEEMICQAPRLKFLDLHHVRLIGFRKWRQQVLSEYFSLKCPALTQDKIDTLNALDVSNKVFKFLDIYKTLLEDQTSDIGGDFFLFHIKWLLESLVKLDRKSKRRSILKLIRFIVKVCPFDYRVCVRKKVYHKLMPELRKDFEGDSKFVIYVLHNLCTTIAMQYLVLIEDESENLEFFIRHALKQKYDFWGVYDNRRCPNFVANPLMTCMLMQYCENSEILLKYGFPYVFSRPSYERLCHSLYLDTQVLDQETGYLIDCGPVMCGPETTLLELSPANLRSQMALHLFLIYLRKPCVDFDEILAKWSRSFPEPYLTPSEMYARLNHYVRPSFMHEFRKVITFYQDEVDYDDDQKQFTPRKLSHLSRCTIRKQLHENWQLPDGIYKLDIPKRVKEYLLLEW